MVHGHPSCSQDATGLRGHERRAFWFSVFRLGSCSMPVGMTPRGARGAEPRCLEPSLLLNSSRSSFARHPWVKV